MTSPLPITADGLGQEFIFKREFAAPRRLVFAAWTEPARLAQWWGPRGFTNPVCEWPAKVGGQIYVVMRAPDGSEYPMGGEVREIVPPERMVFTTGAMDEKKTLLFEFLHTLTLTETDGKTQMTLQSRVVRTTPGAGRYIGGFEAGMGQSLEKLTELVDDVTKREIVVSRVFHAPRALVWDAMTKAEHVVNWWGPRGFSTTIETMDVRPGGVWQHTMRGPDGAKYPNKSVFKEVIRPDRIVYSHGGGREGGPGVSFTATWTFEEIDATHTRLTLRQVFATPEQRDFVVTEFGAIEGGRQTLERLSEHLAVALTKPFTISREFAAPRDLVWRAWTEREQLMQWFGPKGFTMPTAKLELKRGGIFLYNLSGPNGVSLWGKFVFREIVPPSKMVWINSFSDAEGGTTRHPFSKDPWPLQLLTEVTFTENAGRTTVHILWVPIDATAEEIATFEAGRTSMAQGWGGTLEQFSGFIEKH